MHSFHGGRRSNVHNFGITCISCGLWSAQEIRNVASVCVYNPWSERFAACFCSHFLSFRNFPILITSILLDARVRSACAVPASIWAASISSPSHSLARLRNINLCYSSSILISQHNPSWTFF